MKHKGLFAAVLIGCALSNLSPAVSQPINAVKSTAPAEGEFGAPPNMVLEGVPPVPLSLVDGVEKYTFFRSAHCYSWHPTRRNLLMGTAFAETDQVHFLQNPMGDRMQETFSRERSNGASFQPTAGDYFIFNRDIGGNENFQKFKFDMQSHQETKITAGQSRNLHTAWSNSGDTIAFNSNARDSAEMDLCIMQPGGPNPRQRIVCQLKGEGWQPLDWSADDKQILLAEQISANHTNIWLVDVASGNKTLFLPAESASNAKQTDYSGGQFSPDGKRVYLTCDRDGEFSRLAWVDVDTKEHHYLTPDTWSVDEFELSWDGQKLAYVLNEDSFSSLHIIDTGSGEEMPLPAVQKELQKGLISGLTWHKNNHELGFSYESYATPSDVFSLDTTTGKIDRWTASETGYFDAAKDAVPPHLVRWKSFDGKEIPGILYKPPSRFTGKRPVMIQIHGGPESQARPRYLAKSNYYLNELGVAIIFPNVRGSTGYGKTSLASDDGARREATFKDIGALLDWIKTQPDLDADRVMVAGGSYGGFMTLSVATLYSDRIRCALDIVGISNLISFLENTSAYRRDLRRVEYGDERIPEMREFMKRIAPANHAEDIKKPLFVVQGENDPRVPASEALQMVSNVRKQGTPVWFMMAKDEGHGFQRKANSDYLFYATVLFIKKYLLAPGS